MFDRYITYRDIRQVLRRTGAHTVSEGSPDEARFVGQTSLLTNTSKMGCFSWNLPAAPEAQGGTCPGAQLAFYIGPDGKDRADLAEAIERSRSHAAQQLRAEVPNAREAVERFVCNGCYAMKGAYGNPTMVTLMEWRRMWLVDWAMARNLFIPTMIGAIKASQLVSRKQLRRAGADPFALAESTNPRFFRIHDAGDFMNEEYLDSWLEICAKLPDVNFWAPSRIWAHAHMATVLEDRAARGKIPKNLSIRPSGLFFDSPSPNIPGVSGGASSNTVSFSTRRGKIKTDVKGASPEAWVCPAYLPSSVGGGALPVKLTVVQAAKPLSEDRKKRLLAFMSRYVRVPSKGTTFDRVKVAAKRLKPAQRETFVEHALMLKAEQMTNGKPESNPKQQSFAMYPPYDAATPAPKDDVFYEGVYDPNRKVFIIDPSTGRPVRATGETLSNHPGTVPMKVQQFQAAGACAVARDPNHGSACRVCWGTTNDRRTDRMRSLPIVYSKH